MFKITWKLSDESNDSCGPMTGSGKTIAKAAIDLLKSMDDVFELEDMYAADLLEAVAEIATAHVEGREASSHHDPDFTMPETAYDLTLAECDDDELPNAVS